MAEQPIKGTEVIDSGIFDNLLKQADQVIIAEKEIIATNKELLKSYREIANASTINNSSDLKKQAENTNKVNESIKNLTQSELYLLEVEKAKKELHQEEIKLKRAIENENKRLQKSLNDLNGSYKKGTQDLANLKKQLKELEFTGRTNGKLYKALSSEFVTLDSKVRKAEKSVGEFNRNVGNYPKALEGIGNKLVAAFSVGSVAAFGKKVIETRVEFQKFEAVLTNTLGSSSAAKRSLEQIQQIAAKTPFSVKELTESYVKLVNQGFKPTTAEITKLGDLAASQGKSFDQLTEGIIDAQAGEFERLKEFGIKASKSGDQVTFSFKGVKTTVKNTGDEINKYILSLGDLEGVSGGMAAISETLGGKISNLGDNFDSLFNLIGESGQGFFSSILDGFNSLLGSALDLQKSLNKVENSLKAVNQQQTLGEKLKGETKSLVEYQIELDAIGESSLSNSQKLFLYGKALVTLNKSYADGKISITEYQKSLTLLGNSTNDINEIIKENQATKEKDNSLTKEQLRLAKELAKAEQDLQNQLVKLRIDNTQLNEQQEIANAKNEKRLAEERLAESKGSAKTKTAIQLNLEEQLRQKLFEINEKYRNAEKEQSKKDLDEKLKLEKEQDDKIISQTQETANRLQEISDQNADKEAKKQAKKRAKREQDLKDTIEFGEQLLGAVTAQVAKESEIRQAAINKDIENANKNTETQKRLAEAGKQNTLAEEEEAAKVKKELALQQEKEAEIKRQKALLFVKSVMSFIDKGDEPAIAFGKAAASMALVETASAAFIDGTENVGKDKQFAKNKFSNGTDGYVARFDGDERILNPEQNKKIGNLSNEALADLAYRHNNGLLDTAKYAVVQSTDFATKINDSALLQQNALLIKELKEVKQAINDKPVPNFAMNQYHEFVLTTIENGFIKNRTFKNRKSRIC